jgi:hypothetical protein
LKVEAHLPRAKGITSQDMELCARIAVINHDVAILKGYQARTAAVPV